MTSLSAEHYYTRLQKECESKGYYLNPDKDFVITLIDGLLTNKNRYGYEGCPCIENSGDRDIDRDIICPCDYRDDDLEEYGTCYCSLFVSEDVAAGKKKVTPIPLRRTTSIDTPGTPKRASFLIRDKTGVPNEYPVWRCAVCGYLCARNAPPQKCPICKADQDRFQGFSSLNRGYL